MKKKHLFIGFLALLTISCSQENSFFPMWKLCLVKRLYRLTMPTIMLH